MADFVLTDNERASVTWIRLKAHLEDRLSQARTLNDNVSLGPEDTASLRGRIRLLKSLIALGENRPMTGNGEDAP
jgi:hypothetical protein